MREYPDEFVHPPAVDPGDQVAILPPSKVIPSSIVDRGVERLRNRFGVEPVVSDLLDRGDEYVRAHPQACAAAFHEAFEDPEVSAVVAAIGGDRQVRMTRHLDLERLRANPTRFFGISDNTNLHTTLSAAGVVSYYGGQVLPGLATDLELPAYTEEFLRRALFEDRVGEIRPAEEYTDDHFHFDAGEPRDWDPAPGWTFERFDSADPVVGRTWGGCLEVLEWILAADRNVPAPGDVAGDVLLLETSEELPSATQVRRNLTCLGERGLLGVFDGVLVGRPKTRHREARSDAVRREYREDQRAAIRESLDRYNPDAGVVFDVDFGHTDPHVPVPVGGEVRIDPVAEIIAFE